MTVTRLKSDDARRMWRKMLDGAFNRKEEFVIERYNEPVAAIVNFAEWTMLKRLHAEELKRRSADTENFISWEDAKAQMIADGILDA